MPSKNRCVDAGLGSRERTSHTCAGRVLRDRDTGERVCNFHARMRCFREAWDPVGKEDLPPLSQLGS